MSTLFAELERTGLNCPSTYPAPSPTTVNSVSAVAVAAAVAANNCQLQSSTVHQQQQQQQSQQNCVQQQQQQQQSSQQQLLSTTSATSQSSHQSVVTSVCGSLGSTAVTSTPPGGGGQNGCNVVNGLVEDQRALQLAFELSMVGLSDAITNAVNVNGPQGIGGVGGAQFTDLTNCGVVNPATAAAAAAAAAAVLPPGATINSFASILPGIEDRSKKSQNMTECVPVPSSEHVAEIVGRQGCKIKALRAKTNTYIKTPVRGEEPVFVVTGRKEDVGKAKREILSAAEHFSLIRASRKPALSGLNGNKGAPPGPPANIPGQVTIQVRVPYRVVGLVVGPKGATIKHIQQQTHTYIVTPSRDKEPIFEVTGMPDNVQAARRQIEAHIALRTGNIGVSPSSSSPSTNGTNGMNGIGSLLGEDANSEFLASLYKNGFGSLLGYLDPNGVTNGTETSYAPVSSSTGSRSCSSSSSSTSSKSATTSRPELISIWKNAGDSIDVDEGLGESPNIWTLPAVSSTIGSRCSPSTSVSPTDSLLGGGSTGSAISNVISAAAAAAAAAAVNTTQSATTVNASLTTLCRRECLVCGDKEVTAALVPCGHNMFCMECANRICGSNDGICPVCSQTVIQAIRIIP